MPAILLVIFATLSLDRGLDNWFSTRIQSIIANSIDVASAYVNEQGQVIRSDALGMARELESSAQLLDEDPDAFKEFLTAQAALRAIPVAYVIRRQAAKLIAQATSRSEIAIKKPPLPGASKPPMKGVCRAGAAFLRRCGRDRPRSPAKRTATST